MNGCVLRIGGLSIPPIHVFENAVCIRKLGHPRYILNPASLTDIPQELRQLQNTLTYAVLLSSAVIVALLSVFYYMLGEKPSSTLYHLYRGDPMPIQMIANYRAEVENLLQYGGSRNESFCVAFMTSSIITPAPKTSS